MLASCPNDDRTIRLWKLEDRSFRVLAGHDTDVMMTVAFSRDGLTLASGDCDGQIRLWDVNDGRCIRELGDRRFAGIFSITFAPDGETIASAAGALETDDDDDYGCVLLWDVSDTDAITFTTVTVFDKHNGLVHSLECSPDGRCFASGVHDGTVRLWNAADSSCARVMAVVQESWQVIDLCFRFRSLQMASFWHLQVRMVSSNFGAWKMAVAWSISWDATKGLFFPLFFLPMEKR
jgi:WD40 repeat protein